MEAPRALSWSSFATAAPSPATVRFALAWGLGWALAGALVAAGFAFTRGTEDFWPILKINVLFAEVVGFTALTSARVIFPQFIRLPYLVRIALEVLTLFSGTVFGSLLIAASQPLFSLGRARTVMMIILINAALAVVVGIALHTYDRMRRQIEQSFMTLREKEAIERQVEIAREVQRELFPRSVPDIPGLEMAGICLPAVGIGGDYYDFLPLNGESVGLVIADVSGKGIPAALLMAGLQSAVRGLVLPTIPASDMTRRLNEVLYRSTSAARFATMFFSIYDGRSRRLVYSNAGHNPPLQVRRNGMVRLNHGGIPLGVLGDATYEQGECSFEPGDILALYTDGVTEARSASGDEFGEDRLAELITTHRGKKLDELMGIILEDVQSWVAGSPPHDDLTLVLARAR